MYLLNPKRVSYFDAKTREILKPPFRTLDAGCGGRLVSNTRAAHFDYTVEGVDLSSAALQFANKSADEIGLGSRVNFQHASVYAVPFPDNSFDVVIMSDVLEHLLDLKKALREVARVL